MINRYDCASIIFYFVFVVTVGITFSRRNKNTSDYFRGGGIMPWWMAGVSAWMASFSAWTFTGAAGKIYSQGAYVLCLYYSSILPLLVLFCFTCYRFRRMRVVTPLEAVRIRFGPATQQFVTWLRLPFLLLFGGVALNTVGVFMAGAFDQNLQPLAVKLQRLIAILPGLSGWAAHFGPMQAVIIILGVMVTLVSLVGGAFGVAASDFVQMLLVVTITLVISALALMQPKVGGLSGMIHKLPEAHFNWGEFSRPEFILLWFLALMTNNLFGQNTMEMSSKYLMARSDAQARKMMLFPIVGTIVGPLMWMIPPLVAAAAYSPAQMRAIFPNLGSHPEEGAFLLTAHDVLPQGMLGLLIAGIFGATLSSLDGGVNQGVGILVRNFYLPVINPGCPENKLLIISKTCTALFGIIIICLGLYVSQHRTLPLFDLLNQLGVSLWLPLAIPMCLGLFYKRTPPWSSWTTVLIGLAISILASFGIRPANGIDPNTLQGAAQSWLEFHLHLSLPTISNLIGWLPGLAGPYKPEEATQFTLFATVAGVVTACVGWFFFTSLFYEWTSAAYKATVNEFFLRLRTPIGELTQEQVKENHKVVGAIGLLCIIFGTFVLLMTLVPNALLGRLAFIFCGGIIFMTGLVLRSLSERNERRINNASQNVMPVAGEGVG
jgi:Na+/proline symporter